MSFKSRLIEYCESVKLDCPHCPFREPCNMTNDFSIPSHWSDYSFEEMRNQTWLYMQKMSNDLSEISRLMTGATADDVVEFREQANEFSHKLDEMEESKGG